MAYNFPNSPSNGDTVTVNGIIYTYISADNAWKTGTGQTPAILSDGSTPTLGSGITAAEIRTLIGSVDLSSVDSDIIPDGDATRDLGSSSAKFKDLYLSGNTLHLGAQTLEADSSSVILSQLKIGAGSNQVTLSGGAGGTLETGGSTIFSGVFADLTSKPTTLAGYGITDGATTSYVTTQINNVIDSAPGVLNTLNELAAALNDDANFSTTVTNSLATKAPLASPTLTGTPAAPTASTGTNTTQIATTAFVQANKFSGAFSDLSGKPTTIAGYGITNAFDGAFSSLSGKPTTIAGYGITDAFGGAFSDLSGKPTTIAGYGITNALTTGADADIGSNDFITTGKVYFANMFSQLSNLPSATTYHGMFAHVHATGAAYFAHGGNWIELANKSYVDSEVTALVASAPGALDTLNELAAALNDDANFSTTVTNSIATKAPLASPSLTGTPTAPTATSGANTTQIATTAFVQAAVTGGGSYNNASVDSHLNRSTASPNEVLSWNGSDYDWVAQSGGSGGASVTVSETAPSSPSIGDLWFDPSVLKTFVYYNDGTANQWVQSNPTGGSSSGGGASVSISDTAPSSPSAGNLWYKSDTSALYIYYNDGDSSQWVGVSGPPGADGATGAAGAAATGYGQVPIVYTEPPTTHTLNSDGSTSTVQMQAVDPEGTAITYGIAYANATNARPNQLAADTAINQSTGTFTFDPSTNNSHAGSFKARLSASDGITHATRFVDFNLVFTVDVEYLVIAGGGGSGAGSAAGGGGGAGGYRTATGFTLQPGTAYSITVGAGGAGSTSPDNNNGTNGTDSVFGSITAVGGGGGAGTGPASASYAGNGLVGGSGGGGRYGGTGGAGTSGQGNAGGASTNGGARGSGGGGGAGAAGTDGGTGTTAAGSGGAGLASSITGTSVTRAGGGGGATWNSQTYTNGGAGGGGNGGASASAGTANTGGGGGGNGSSVAGQAGGSGVVIIAAQQAASSVSGTYSLDTSGRSGWHVYTFTAGTGSITF